MIGCDVTYHTLSHLITPYRMKIPFYTSNNMLKRKVFKKESVQGDDGNFVNKTIFWRAVKWRFQTKSHFGPPITALLFWSQKVIFGGFLEPLYLMKYACVEEQISYTYSAAVVLATVKISTSYIYHM